MRVLIPRARTALNGLAILVLAALLFVSQAAIAQQGLSIPDIPVDGNVGTEQLESAIAAVETLEGLDDESRARAIEHLRDAGVQIQNRIAAEATVLAFREALKTAPAETQKLRLILDEDAAPAPTIESLGITEESTLADLERGLASELANLSALEARVSTLETQIETEVGRPAEARQRINSLRANKVELEASISAPAPPGEQKVLTDARRLASELRRRAQEAEISKLEQELLSHDVRTGLSKAQHGIEARSLIELKRRTELFRMRVNAERQTTAMLAQQTAAAAELAAADKHPVVRELAEGQPDPLVNGVGIASSKPPETFRSPPSERQKGSFGPSVLSSKPRMSFTPPP